MNNISVVIIAKNESLHIGDCIKSALKLTDDVVVVDSGSTDNTKEIVLANGGKLVEAEWHGYGINRNIGAEQAKYNWILSVDADERVTDPLASLLLNDPLQDNTIYGCKRLPFIGNKAIRFGGWANDKVLRLYNKKITQWNSDAVHETIIQNNCSITYLNAYLLHYTVSTTKELFSKVDLYAQLGAEKYYRNGKKGARLKVIVSPVFVFIQNFFIRLGLLDGWEGYQIAKSDAISTYLKYSKLIQLQKK